MMPFTCLRDTSPVASTTALMSALLLIEPGFLPPSAFFAAMCFSSGKWVSKRSAHTTKRKRADPEKQAFRRRPFPRRARKGGGWRGFPLFCRRFLRGRGVAAVDRKKTVLTKAGHLIR